MSSSSTSHQVAKTAPREGGQNIKTNLYEKKNRQGYTTPSLEEQKKLESDDMQFERGATCDSCWIYIAFVSDEACLPCPHQF